MQKRNKAGGIVDRRFGENDPTMAPEDRMLERFTREKQRRVRGGEIFNLEDEDELTHCGKSLGGLREIGQGLLKDNFDGEEGEEDADAVRLSRKRPLGEDDEEGSGDEVKGPERKKSKAEVMKEVMAKSKLHKYERQKLKEDDEDEREKLDAEMGELWVLLGARQPSRTGAASGANNEPLGGGETLSNDKPVALKPSDGDGGLRKKEIEYDQAVREMMFDKRSKPADRTKTEEEKAAEESERLKKLEDARQRRMRGEESEGEGPADGADDQDRGWEEEERIAEAAVYGLGDGIPGAVLRAKPDGNPEDYLDGDYEVSEDGYVDVGEDGMVDGDIDFSDEDDSGAGTDAEADEDEEDFLASVFLYSGVPRKEGDSKEETARDEKLAFTFPCPQTHKEMLEITKDIAVEDTPTVVQRIRVLHHAKLAAENKAKLQVGPIDRHLSIP